MRIYTLGFVMVMVEGTPLSFEEVNVEIMILLIILEYIVE
jgi:hypothetical protein